MLEEEDAMPTVIYAIGHSTRAIEDFIEVRDYRQTRAFAAAIRKLRLTPRAFAGSLWYP